MGAVKPGAVASSDATPPEHRPVPAFHLKRARAPAELFGCWRDTLAPLFDVEPETPATLDAFTAGLSFRYLGPAIVGQVSASAQVVRRSPATIARSGIGHILIRAHLAGRCDGEADGRPISAEAGDVSILDLSRPCEFAVSAFENAIVIAPRASFARDFDDLDALHGLVISRHTALGALMNEHVRALEIRARDMVRQEAIAIAHGSVALLAAYAKPSVEAWEAAAQGAGGSQLAAMLRHVEDNLESADLNVTSLLQRFNLSRASIYRAFQPLGGVSNHIMDRRLARAFLQITSPEHQHRRIMDIALDLGFSNESAFSRTFRQRFGLSPREARLGARPAGRRPGLDMAAPAVLAKWIDDIAKR